MRSLRLGAFRPSLLPFIGIALENSTLPRMIVVEFLVSKPIPSKQLNHQSNLILSHREKTIQKKYEHTSNIIGVAD
jgi:hypothetical protein